MVNKYTVDFHPSQKIKSVHFYSCPKQNSPPSFYHYPPGMRKLPIPPQQRFLKIYFFPSRKGGEL